MASDTNVCGGIGCFTVMFFIFMTLKLLDKIDWSWWWVTAPLWAPFGLVMVALCGYGLLALAFGGKRK